VRPFSPRQLRAAARYSGVRAYARQRERLIQEALNHLQHVRQAMDEMNLHLHHVLDDLGGLSGQAIVTAIPAGVPGGR
jgi:transposase